MDWNSERVEQLETYWEEGLSSGKIAQIMGCTRNMVIGKAHRLHLSARGPSESQSPLPKTVRIRKPAVMNSRAPLQPQPLPTPEPEPSPGIGVPLLELEHHHCRFIVGSSETGQALYCGDKKHFGSYCAHHAKLCYHNPQLRY